MTRPRRYDRLTYTHHHGMLCHMRTTVRLPDELYTRVRVSAATEGTTVTSFIEDALRAALLRHEQAPDRPPYEVEPFEGNRLQPGVNLDDSAELLDRMDSDARN